MSEQDDEGLRREPQLSDGLGALPAAASAASTPANASQKSRSGVSTPEAATDAGWERGLLEKLLMSTLAEQRTARRWRNIFRFMALGAFLITLGVLTDWFHLSDYTASSTRHTAVIELNGVLEAKGQVDAGAVIDGLRAAFKDPGTAGIVLRINSPGGSPVQAGLINDEIRRLRAANPTIPVYAVIEEICASGGYYVAVAADRIYVDKASLVGSIGVLMDGFGFTGTMEKAGVERRLITAGDNKGFLDPFSPMNESQQAFAKAMLATVHQQFIDTVKAGRGKRLKPDPELFSGLVWTGATSIEMGLADELGSLRSVARDVIKAEELVDFTRAESFAERLAKRAGVSAGQVISRELGASAQSLRLR
jgi:protease-4